MSKYVDRFCATERVNHWVVVVSFFILVFSGLGLYSPVFFGYFSFFGGPQKAMAIHKWTGIVFSISSVILFLSHYRALLAFDSDDRRWLRKMGGYLSRQEEDIPQGKFNAGQKAFGIFAFVATVVLAITGLVIWDAAAFGRGLTRVSLMLHGLFFVLIIVSSIVHIYLATIGNPGTSGGMLWGQVTKGWAKKHAVKWYREVVKD